MTLPGNFRNFSTFRLLLLFALLLLGAWCLHDTFRRGSSFADTENTPRLWKALQEGTDVFSNHLAVQESLGLSAAMQLELLGENYKRETTDEFLEKLMATAPQYIRGLGIRFAGGDSESQRLAYVSRQAEENFTLASATQPMVNSERGTAREVNLDRKMNWRLFIASADDGKHFFTLFTVTLQGNIGGQAIVMAELVWLDEVFSLLEAGGAKMPLCVSPAGEILWRDKDGLHCDADSSDRDAQWRQLFRQARAFAHDQGDVTQDSFLKSDLLGTGWMLLVPQYPAASKFPWAFAGFLTVLAALVLEGIVNRQKPVEPFRYPTVKNDGPGVFRGAHNLLFKYRITDPVQAQLDSEMRVARQIQFSLVPEAFPGYSVWREFDLWSFLAPAREIGGDFYDFFMLDARRLMIAVGDVSGKGVPAALYMAVTRTALRALAGSAESPGDLLTRLNDMLLRDNQSGLYVTVACVFVDLPTGACQYGIAGHPAPLWYHKRRGRAETVDQPREIFLGMKTGIAVPTGNLQLERGDTLLLYTDGASEARNDDGAELGDAGILSSYLHAVASPSCREVIESIEASVQHFMGKSEQVDDITLLALRYWGPGGQKTSGRSSQSSVRIFGDGKEPKK